MSEQEMERGPDELDDDVFAVRVRVTPEQAAELIRRGNLDFGDRPHLTEDAGGGGLLGLFVTRAQLEALRAEGFEVQVASNQSARARERLAEIAEGDRFEGGRVPPRGIGRKVGGRGEGPDRPS